MKLFIDTSNREEIIIGLDGDRFETEARRDKSQKLLVFIDEVLDKKGKKLEDVNEIVVNVGPGSFTGLRVGVSVANAVGWVLNILVNGRNVKKDGPVEPVYN